jgi:hypothetical protein
VSGTPIATASGVADMVKTDDSGNASFYVDPGRYHFDIYGADTVTFLQRYTNVDMGLGYRPTILGKSAGGDSTDTISSSLDEAVNSDSLRSYKQPGYRYFHGQLADENKNGIVLYGDGSIIEMDADENYNSWRLRWSYADSMDFVVGREYLVNIPWVMFSGETLKGTLVGDSTTHGYPLSGAFLPENLLDLYAKRLGFGSTDIQNLAVDGSKSSDMPVDDIRPTDNFVLVGYGINDLPDGLEAFYNNMDAKLAEIRTAYPYEDGPTTSGAAKDIILKGLNSLNHWQAGAGQYSAEKMRGVYIELARKHKCCFIDIYAWMQDSTNGGTWMDTNAFGGESQTNTHVHPLEVGNGRIWSKVADAMFGGVYGPNGANEFLNRDQYGSTVIPTVQPSDFIRGQTWDRMFGVDLPFAVGTVQTRGFADTPIYQQTAFRWTGDTSAPLRVERVSVSASVWGPWSNAWTNLTLSNGWTTTGGILSQIKVDPYGRTALRGSIEAGTKTDGTVLFTVAAQFRPLQNEVFLVPTDVGTQQLLLTASSGEVSLLGATTANTLRLSGLSWFVSGM